MPQNILTTTVQKLLAQLAPSRVDDRDSWLKIGMAIHKVFNGGEDGLPIWIEWSRQSCKFIDGECEKKWQEFDCNKANVVNLGTIRAFAKADNLLSRDDPSVEKLPVAKEISPPKKDGSIAKLPARVIINLNTLLKKGLKIPIQTLDELITGVRLREVARWFYHDRDGNEILCVIRFENSEGKKTYRQLTKVGIDWRWGGIDSRCPLYNLPTIIVNSDEPIIVCEGEKAVDAAVSLGYVNATTSCQGAQSPGKTDWTPLAGRIVYILPDNDKPGKEYAARVVRILTALNPPAQVKIVTIPNLSDGGDVYDFVQMGGTREQLDKIIATPAQSPVIPRKRWETIRGCDLEIEPIEWLWQDRLQAGALNLIVGYPNEGKSIMVEGDFAARVTLGKPWPDGSPCKQGDVLILANEDSKTQMLLPRFKAAGGDDTRVIYGGNVYVPCRDGADKPRNFRIVDLDLMEEELINNPQCNLVIVDPITDYAEGDVDEKSNIAIRNILQPINALAEKYKRTIVAVHHRRKAGSNRAADVVHGSIGYVGVSRTVWLLVADPDNEDRRKFLPVKINAVKRPKGWAFNFRGERQETWIEWENKPIDGTADDEVKREQEIARKPKSSEAADWLKGILSNGPMRAADIEKEGHQAGFSWSTIGRASVALNIDKVRQGFGAGGAYTWNLPTTEDKKDEKTN